MPLCNTSPKSHTWLHVQKVRLEILQRQGMLQTMVQQSWKGSSLLCKSEYLVTWVIKEKRHIKTVYPLHHLKLKTFSETSKHAFPLLAFWKEKWQKVRKRSSTKNNVNKCELSVVTAKNTCAVVFVSLKIRMRADHFCFEQNRNVMGHPPTKKNKTVHRFPGKRHS